MPGRKRTYLVLDKRERPLGTVTAENAMDAFNKARKAHGELAHHVKRTGNR